MEDAALRLELPLTERTGAHVRSGCANESGCNRNSVAERTSRQALECQFWSDGDGARGEGNHRQSRVRGAEREEATSSWQIVFTLYENSQCLESSVFPCALCG